MRFLAALLGAILILVTASPADAAPSGRTVRLARTVGVDITVPASVDLGSGFTGGTITRQLGAVEVRDSRGQVNPNTWVATVSATVFVTGAGGAQQTIANDRVSYWSGPAVRSTGGGMLVPGQPTSAQAVTLDVAREAFRKTAGNGNNMVAWVPTVRIAIPTGIVGGTYRGTITHSVA
ncbi:hypothetical protein [Micromonospora echinofusca]|uniref:DUF4402 domain-containing protein n=1 Tax=Micromonospora echinofusca TaxID=47858 RepID=A0A1C5GJG1_MICEH|nr:hypothetical protein [Micromonospora echinofusca]SCG19712.1 hypothetical protein GA0070610_6099 [Micromonospora echinofusca]